MHNLTPQSPFTDVELYRTQVLLRLGYTLDVAEAMGRQPSWVIELEAVRRMHRHGASLEQILTLVWPENQALPVNQTRATDHLSTCG
jgi:hypothetical protein